MNPTPNLMIGPPPPHGVGPRKGSGLLEAFLELARKNPGEWVSGKSPIAWPSSSATRIVLGTYGTTTPDEQWQTSTVGQGTDDAWLWVRYLGTTDNPIEIDEKETNQ